MKSRQAIELGERFNERWLGYAVAATAAGAGLLAAAQPARADIIYTSGNIQVSGLSGYGEAHISFDNGTDWDLTFLNRGIATSCSWCIGGGEAIGSVHAFAGASNNGVALNGGPLPKGYQIGPMGSGPQSALLMTWGYRRVRTSQGGTRRSTSSAGPWAGQAGYLGVKFFALDGQIHYGWIAGEGNGTEFDISGWAYNTIPNAPIDAGQTTATPEPATLGLLALGSLGLGYWRRRKAVASQRQAAGSGMAA